MIHMALHRKTPDPSSDGVTLNLTASWIIFSAWCVISGQVLSFFGILNQTGYAVALVSGIILSVWPLWKSLAFSNRQTMFRWKRFTKIFPLLYLACFILAFVGGCIHPPTNYDAFCYRIPRMLHWLDEGKYHWIGGFCSRMDFSSLGFEWLMLPGFAVFKTLRLAFLINGFSFLLMPGLVFSSFTALRISRRVAATWMWIIPCASCFAMEAGSIGNDFTAAIYLLAAITYALKARETGKTYFVWLALVATGMLTGAKVSNLPLLLPIGICLLASFYKHPKHILPAVGASVIALIVSFAPLAIVNLKHTGDWTGSPNSIQNLKNPIIGLAGNSVQLGIASLCPAVFPAAPAWNRWILNRKNHSPLAEIRRGFPELNVSTLEMASEEGAGLGLGVTGAAILAVLGSLKFFRIPKLHTISIWVSASFWIALLVAMMKLGNPSFPRIIACYYPMLLPLPLILCEQSHATRCKWWRLSAFVLLVPIIPALIFNPARPILRLDKLTGYFSNHHPQNSWRERFEAVYGVYENRSDGHRKVRELLPQTARTIGFAGTDGDSEYSFWLPLGVRRVRDFTPLPDRQIPSPDGLDAIVTSDWGSNDRFGITPEQLAAKIGWRLAASTPIRRMVRDEPMRWCVLVPAEPRSAH